MTEPLIWHGRELVTYGDIGRAIDRIVLDGTKEDAKQFVEAYEAVNPNARANVGYLAGYYEPETMRKIWDWFECSHPIFARIVPTPEAAFKAGQRQAMKGDHS
jgi:hypothetical protein